MPRQAPTPRTISVALDEVAHAKPNREFRTGRVGVRIERPRSSISYVPCWYYVLRTSSQLGTATEHTAASKGQIKNSHELALDDKTFFYEYE